MTSCRISKTYVYSDLILHPADQGISFPSVYSMIAPDEGASAVSYFGALIIDVLAILHSECRRSVARPAGEATLRSRGHEPEVNNW